ncbi:MAG TPA: ribonuclease R, partial [Pseudomonadota bacterium]|nr:ribonuclease R [Pseudomonadota bacterium]
MKGKSGPPRRPSPEKKAAPWLPDRAPARDRPPATGARPGRGQPAPKPRTQPIADPHAAREAKRYADPIPSREAIAHFLAEKGELLTAERLAEELQLTEPTRLDALVKRLAAMVRDGQLLQNRRGGYAPAQKLDLIAGEVLANAEGYGFLRPDDGGEDLYLSPAQMRAVLHGDRALASVVGLDRRGRREGAIVEVLERRAPRLVGRYQEQDGFGLVVPDDRRIHQDLLIPLGRNQGARNNQIVVAEIVDPPTRERPPVGRVLAVLGERLTASLTVRMAIESHGLPHEWPASVLREAERVAPEVDPREAAGREDLRALPLVTIDGEDARDFDDA